MNQTEQMREALRKALSALETCQPEDTSTGHVIYCSFDSHEVQGAIEAVEQALATEPAKLVRLTEDRIYQIQRECSFEFTQRKFAHAIMDAMERVNGGANE